MNARVQVPVDSKGNYDFEVVESLDIADLADRLVRLCRGEAVPSRTYDFLTHEPMEHPEKPWKLGDKEIIIVEGIHGLNPAFTGSGGLVSFHSCCPVPLFSFVFTGGL